MFGANLSTVSATLSMSLSVACQTLSFLVPIHTAPLFLLIAIFLVSGTTANNSTYADTAYYVQQAQSALTAVVSQNSTNATYADTAEFVDLSQHGQNMQVVQSDNAQITLRSSGDGSASFLTLIAKEPDGDQTELRVMNEGNTNELKVYDASS